jgi:hypothetical protein
MTPMTLVFADLRQPEQVIVAFRLNAAEIGAFGTVALTVSRQTPELPVAAPGRGLPPL